jgi:hypothetical protein
MEPCDYNCTGNNATDVVLSYAASALKTVKQKTIAFIIQAERVRKNPDIFQKICQIGEAIFGLMIGYSPRFAYLASLKWSLGKTANLTPSMSIRHMLHSSNY